MQTLIDSIYDRLRSIGVSVETADATALLLVEYSHDKREAFYLWCRGITYRNIEKITGIPRSTICDFITNISDKV